MKAAGLAGLEVAHGHVGAEVIAEGQAEIDPVGVFRGGLRDCATFDVEIGEHGVLAVNRFRV